MKVRSTQQIEKISTPAVNPVSGFEYLYFKSRDQLKAETDNTFKMDSFN